MLNCWLGNGYAFPERSYRIGGKANAGIVLGNVEGSSHKVYVAVLRLETPAAFFARLRDAAEIPTDAAVFSTSLAGSGPFASWLTRKVYAWPTAPEAGSESPPSAQSRISRAVPSSASFQKTLAVSIGRCSAITVVLCVSYKKRHDPNSDSTWL